MCTLTILPRPKGFLLTMNRDELRSRQEAGVFSDDASGICYPVDGLAGGTWVGVSREGFAMSLLNRYQDPSREGAKTRGKLIATALRQGSAKQAMAYMQSINAEEYNPFDCFLVSPTAAHRFCWDGKSLSESGYAGPLMLTSSSERLEEVLAYRRGLFNGWKKDYDACANQVDRFHLTQEAGQSHRSVLMAREVTHTKSLVQISVTPTECSLTYFDESSLQANQRLNDLPASFSWNIARSNALTHSVSELCS